MAELKRQTLGDTSGASGHFVFKIRGEKNFVARRPLKKDNPPAPGEVVLARRAKFSLAGKVAGGIYKAGPLKEIWPKPAANNGTRFSAMFKKNYNDLGTYENLGTAWVIPDHGFEIQNAAIALSQKGMTITADELGAVANIDPNIEKYLVAVGIVIMTQPLNSSDEPFKVLSVKSGMQSLDNDQSINIVHEFTSAELSKYKSYTDKKVFLTFLTLTSAGVPVQWTEQFNN
jgi:hypothetical protein